jgi:signal transduction histidine kinase/ActR/RegA family two-component response regulator
VTSSELEGRVRLLVRELSGAEIELSARAERLEQHSRRLRALEQLAQRLAAVASVDEGIQHFSELLRSVLGACGSELWRGEVLPERVEEQVRRAAAEARRTGRIISYVEPSAPAPRRHGLIVPLQRFRPLPDLVVFSSESPFGEHDPTLLSLGAALLESTLRSLAAAHDLRESQSQLHQRERMNSLGQLAGGVAHDFNNTLMVISAAAEVMADTLAPEDPCAPHLELIINTSQRAAQLTQKLLAFSRKSRLATQTIDLHDVLGALRELLSHALDRRITLTLSLANGPFLVEADATQLQNAFLNVCLNARDAMPEGGTLRISTERAELDAAACARLVPGGKPGRYVRVEVRDTGTGMDDQTLARAFDPFFTTKEPGLGTGLGLSLVSGSIREHRGAVTLESQVGVGTCCSIWLPLIDRTRPESNLARPDPHSGAGRRILLLDDEPGVCRTAAQLLRQQGHNVQALRSGERALSHLRAHSNGYDLLVLDVMMPHPTGVEVYRSLVHEGIVLPTIFVSGYTEQPLLEGLIDTPGVVFLQKPFRQVDLADAMARCLASIGGEAAMKAPPAPNMPEA